ncbi:hypothetical protein [Spiroplasma endosymbiont of Dromius quadrimaculatus]|uniref:hypothetical protein n=1 Tax=Spiroplasma endosymbiont of Dromius quadrimaculatus TaxID=3066283 RepID=UPI00313B4144
MWKFLSALNLVCVMFVSGCNKANISELGEKNICGDGCGFEFSVLKNTFFNIESFPVPSAGRITFFDDNVSFSSDIVKTSFLLENRQSGNLIERFFEKNGFRTRKVVGNFSNTQNFSVEGWQISELVNVEIIFAFKSWKDISDSQYYIREFTAHLPSLSEKDNEQQLPNQLKI